MPSTALQQWRNDRIPRLIEVETHCVAVAALAPPKPNFLDEMLRGFVLHLSAHFQGFCRDLYTESSQGCIAQMPAGLQATAQLQFLDHIAIETGIKPLPGGIPAVLTITTVQGWRASCDRLAAALDAMMMQQELQRIIGLPPW